MSRITTWAAGMILIIVTAFATTCAPVSVAAQTTPVTNVNPGMGAPGTRFAFMATGFASGEKIAVWVNTPTGAPMAIKAEQVNGANSDGRGDWFWTSSRNAASGTWQMVARGAESGTQRVINFAIVGDPVPPTAETPAQSNVEPHVGSPGTRFAFMATGFASGEKIAVWVNTPTGAPMAITAEELNGANSDGRGDWFWTTPDNAAAGTWQMVARGATSGTQRVISFVVR